MAILSSKEIARIVEVYEDRLAKHGFDVAALKSGGYGKQFARHSVHAELFDLDGRNVLDVGCGIAMFLKFLLKSGNSIASYTGIDIIEPFLEYNRDTFPQGRFLSLDIAADPIGHLKPDVVFMSQMFNARYSETNNEDFAKHVVERFFQTAREGLVVDFMSSYVDYREDEHHYFQPEAMLAFAKSLTPYVALRHDYLKFEFTLALRHEPAVIAPSPDEIDVYD